MSLVAVSSSWKLSIFPTTLPASLVGFQRSRGHCIGFLKLASLPTARLLSFPPHTDPHTLLVLQIPLHFFSPFTTWAWALTSCLDYCSTCCLIFPCPSQPPPTPGASVSWWAFYCNYPPSSMKAPCLPLAYMSSPLQWEKCLYVHETLYWGIQEDNFRISSSHLKIIWGVFYYIHKDNTAVQKCNL